MRFLFLAACTFLFIGCQGDSEINDEVTGNLMEVEPSQQELDEIALVEQPQTVQDFFAIGNGLIGNDFCYDYNSISQLILYGNDGSEDWKKFEVSDNYLTAYHNECGVLLEFMTFDLGGEKKAFLSQMNGNSQQFDYLSWNTRTGRWTKINRYPKPNMVDYFTILDFNDGRLVADYGSDYIYLNPKAASATYVFSEWGMLMNMGEKQELEFNKKPNYYYELNTDQDQLTLTQIPMHTAPETSLSYVVVYGVLKNDSMTMGPNYETLIAKLKDENVQHQLVEYGANNFENYFPSDTFNLQAIQKYKSTNGYWFYEEGKAPLIISADENIEIIIQRAKAYFEAED